ncbi:MAG: hypothetical protein MN733_36730 [Nitrososphaera sp.]|nr:hypothetical protein [Nitrososphaera sp.]
MPRQPDEAKEQDPRRQEVIALFRTPENRSALYFDGYNIRLINIDLPGLFELSGWGEILTLNYPCVSGYE